MENLWVENWSESYTTCMGKRASCPMTNIWQYDGDKTIRKIGAYLHSLGDFVYTNEECYSSKGLKFHTTGAKMIGDVLHKVGPRRQIALVKLEDATFFAESNKDTLQTIIAEAS